MGTIKWSSVESIPRDENYQMVKMGTIQCYLWNLYIETGTVKCYLWNPYLDVRIIKWSSVESVPRDGNYQMVVCGICT